MSFLPLTSLLVLKRGSVIRRAGTEQTFVVASIADSRVTAVASVDVTAADVEDWEVADPNSGFDIDAFDINLFS